MTSLEFIKMAKSTKLYPEFIPFNIVKYVITDNSTNRFTIE